MEIVMSEYGRFIIFLHVFSAIVFIGSLFALNAIAFIGTKIDQDKLKSTLILMQKLLLVTGICIFIVLLSGELLTAGFNYRENAPEMFSIGHIKEVIFTVLMISFFVMLSKRKKAFVFFMIKDYQVTKDELIILSRYLIPFNILLSIVAIYIGVILRGF